MKRFMVWTIALVFLFCTSAIAADTTADTKAKAAAKKADTKAKAAEKAVEAPAPATK